MFAETRPRCRELLLEQDLELLFMDGADMCQVALYRNYIAQSLLPSIDIIILNILNTCGAQPASDALLLLHWELEYLSWTINNRM